MNIDDKINRELESEAQNMDDLLIDQQGMLQIGISALKGGLKRWVILIFFITLVVSVVMFWCGYRFAIAVNLDDRVFWGICLLVSINAQIALKQWSWQEARRISTLREIKRVEIAVARLAGLLQKQ